MRRIGLTGGIGSGKSTVARVLGTLGAVLIDADAISRDTTAAGGAATQPIRAEFGAPFLDSSGALDRDRMRTLVFEDASARARLEAIVHPLVGAEIAAQAAAAHASSARCVVFDVPLLVESGGRWAAQVDAVWVCDCRAETQVERVRQRNNLPRTAVESIIASQATRAQRLAAADVVIYNDAVSLEQLAHTVTQAAKSFGL